MNMTIILLTVSVGCNLLFCSCCSMTASWTLRLSASSAILPDCGGHWTARWQSRKRQQKRRPKKYRTSSARAVSKWLQPGQPLPYRSAQTATLEKGIELSEEDATFDDGNAETASRPAQVPEDKLDETFTSIPPSELEYGRMNRKRVNRIRHGLRAAVLTRLTMRSGQPRTRKRQRKNVRKRQRFSPIWKERNCTTN